MGSKIVDEREAMEDERHLVGQRLEDLLVAFAVRPAGSSGNSDRPTRLSVSREHRPARAGLVDGVTRSVSPASMWMASPTPSMITTTAGASSTAFASLLSSRAAASVSAAPPRAPIRRRADGRSPLSGGSRVCCVAATGKSSDPCPDEYAHDQTDARGRETTPRDDEEHEDAEHQSDKDAASVQQRATSPSANGDGSDYALPWSKQLIVVIRPGLTALTSSQGRSASGNSAPSRHAVTVPAPSARQLPAVSRTRAVRSSTPTTIKPFGAN